MSARRFLVSAKVSKAVKYRVQPPSRQPGVSHPLYLHTQTKTQTLKSRSWHLALVFRFPTARFGVLSPSPGKQRCRATGE